MVKDRRRSVAESRRWLVVVAAALATLGGRSTVAAEPTIRLADAKEFGAFNVGASTATVDRDGAALVIHFRLPTGTAAGVWSKGYPTDFRSGQVDLIRVLVEPQAKQAETPVTVALEIKGMSGTQRLPVAVSDQATEIPIQWGQVGEVSEVVVSVEPRAGHPGAVEGSLRLDVEFAATPWTRKLAEDPSARIASAVVLAGLLAAPLVFRARAKAAPVADRSKIDPKPGFAVDLIRGFGLVATSAMAVAVFDLGALPAIDAGWWFLAVAVAGAVISDLWSYSFTSRHLSSGELFRDAAISGLLAASSSPMAILQPPGSWGDSLRLSQTAASLAFLVYHLGNARRLASSGRHLGAIAGGLIAATPFAFGALVLLASDARGLAGQLGGWIALGTLVNDPGISESIGRVVILWGFNEAIAAGLGLATKGKISGSIRLHLILLGASVVAVAAPWVADYGSSDDVAGWSRWTRPLVTVLAAAVSQAGLWAEVYLVTGLLLDAVAGFAPTGEAVRRHSVGGIGKALVYAGVFMAILQGLGLLLEAPGVANWATAYPLLVAIPIGVLSFPLVKTIIETFDGSQGFFRRASRSYRDIRLYARGGVVGLGLGLAAMLGVSGRSIAERSGFGFGFGALTYAGVNLAHDLSEAAGRRGRVQPFRVYFAQSCLGGFIGAAIGFYFDGTQVAVVVAKFWRYLAVGQSPEPFDVRPFLSKWGRIDLGTTTGGAKLLFDESLAGVISWAVPAWLFAINRTFLAAYFAGETGPIRSLVTPEGRAALGRNMIEVLRWGLWMSPIINSFLRPMGEPTWYNQDGAIRTLFAIGHDATESPEAFQSWSLGVFTALLAYDSLRILIWLDHMGLRVATLVNLSFLGMDKLDEKLARFLSPSSTARCIPEGVKRFTTWAPLLIPFYIPRGHDWDVAWDRSGAGHPPEVVTLAGSMLHWPIFWQMGTMVGLVAAGSAGFSAVRRLGERRKSAQKLAWTLNNPEYSLTVEPSGAVTSQVKARGFDLTRRSYDTLDPAGRALFLVIEEDGSRRTVPILGQFPGGGLPDLQSVDDTVSFRREFDGLRVEVSVTLPDADDPVERWTIVIANDANSARKLTLIPYLEWVLNRPDADRGHTQYNRLFAEMEYVPGLHAVLAWDKHAKALGFIASSRKPDGFLTSRMDFIGRGRSLRSPRALETLAFSTAGETEAHPTFDPIAALQLGVDLGVEGQGRIDLLIGYAPDKAGAIAAIARHLEIPGAADVSSDRKRKELHSIRHGEIPPGTPQPYSEFFSDGRTLRVLTPFTPRPYDHVLSNALGHVVALTNRGLQTTSSGNSQQNRITPDWSDTVTREVPPEAFYLYDPANGEWFSPTFHPINDAEAHHEVDFGVDGTATYHMTKGAISTDLTVFVPPDQPMGYYHLTVHNGGDQPRTIRVASYFQIVLAAQPEAAGPLKIRRDAKANALFFENPRNHFREGPAFAATSATPDAIETSRAHFFGPNNDVARPAFVTRPRQTQPDNPGETDRPIAAFLNTLSIPGHGQATLTVVLGQSDDRKAIGALLRDLKSNPEAAKTALEATRAWWNTLIDTVRVTTGETAFNRYLDWIKYQALAERIWARRGFYQASGAFGFRDQLQDSVNLLWMDPAIARKQILLHASQQFLEGDVVHWFHRLGDGRTGFAARTHASDNLLWLAWGVVEYVEATGDLTLLDESTPYLEAELPFGPLPLDKGGMGFDPLRSSREDTVYRHCLRAIDLVLEHRMGAHGLPLIGTGDWNDGLDEIGSEGRGESVWLGFFLHYILGRMAGIVGEKEGEARQDHYLRCLRDLGEALESTWRDDRYLRAIHDDGTEIGVKGSGVWEIDALTAAWAVMANINPLRGRIVFETALDVLEKDTTILLGWPPLREDTKPYLGRSSGYPEGVRENGMYCHGVQWLVGAARLLAEQATADGHLDDARRYAAAAYRLWMKISPIPHVTPDQIETYGGQPNKQAADMVTTFDPGRMIWHGYTGAAAWMFRQAVEGVLGLRLIDGAVLHPSGQVIAPELGEARVTRDVSASPFARVVTDSSIPKAEVHFR